MQHSEFNPSASEPRALPADLDPAGRAAASRRATRRSASPTDEKRGRLRLIASPDRADGSVLIHQDARVYAGLFDGDERATLELGPGPARLRARRARLARARTASRCDAGDALKITDTTTLVAGRRSRCRGPGVRPARQSLISHTPPARPRRWRVAGGGGDLWISSNGKVVARRVPVSAQRQISVGSH